MPAMHINAYGRALEYLLLRGFDLDKFENQSVDKVTAVINYATYFAAAE
jgi:hypothetical protein